jgi:hypothetical protein
MLLKRKNTDILSKSAQSLIAKPLDDDDGDDVFVKKTENQFHKVMYAPEAEEVVIDF